MSTAAAKGATKPAAARPDLEAELNNLAMSKEAQPLFDAVMRHIEENVAPITEEFYRLGEGRKERWSWAPGQLENEIQRAVALAGGADAVVETGAEDWREQVKAANNGKPIDIVDTKVLTEVDFLSAFVGAVHD